MKSQLSHFLELRNYGIKIPKSCPFITFTSGKGGVGKSSLCVNLATTLGLTHKVLLVDGDPGMADLHILLGKTPDLNWSDFIKGDKSIDEVISKGIHGIDLLHGFSGVTDLDLTSGESIRKILLGLGEVSKNYDVVLIDSGAGINEASLCLATSVDLSYLVLNSDFTSIADSYGALKSMWNFQPDQNIEVLVNRVKANESGQGIYDSFSTVCRQFLKKSPKLCASFADSKSFGTSLIRQTPLIFNDKTSSSTKEMFQFAEIIKRNILKE